MWSWYTTKDRPVMFVEAGARGEGGVMLADYAHWLPGEKITPKNFDLPSQCVAPDKAIQPAGPRRQPRQRELLGLPHHALVNSTLLWRAPQHGAKTGTPPHHQPPRVSDRLCRRRFGDRPRVSRTRVKQAPPPTHSHRTRSCGSLPTTRSR